MIFLIACFLFTIFGFLSGLHFYWAFGGKWGFGAVIPTKDDITPPKDPGIAATLVVAFGLLALGLLVLVITNVIHFTLPVWLERSGLWIIAGIFGIRAIGEFHYVGFFKKHKYTRFGKNDTKYYSPLCLMISVLAFALILLRSHSLT